MPSLRMCFPSLKGVYIFANPFFRKQETSTYHRLRMLLLVVLPLKAASRSSAVGFKHDDSCRVMLDASLSIFHPFDFFPFNLMFD